MKLIPLASVDEIAATGIAAILNRAILRDYQKK
jgi:hypothetical protein